LPGAIRLCHDPAVERASLCEANMTDRIRLPCPSPSRAAPADTATARTRLWMPRLLLLSLAALLVGCAGPQDPEQLLRQARQAHEIEILSMTQHEGEVLFSLRVTEEASPLELPCLTLDVLFLEEGAQGPKELARRQIEADISGLAEAGGTLELTWSLDIPEEVSSAWEDTPPENQAIEIVLHQPGAEGLNALCEAQAIRDQGQ
jgi:hypothetical protein